MRSMKAHGPSAAPAWSADSAERHREGAEGLAVTACDARWDGREHRGAGHLQNLLASHLECCDPSPESQLLYVRQ